MRISLIITTYNKPEYLRLVLERVKKQSVLPFEVIIADDGSGEQTASLIAAMAENFPCPLIHSWQKDDGFRLAMSRNRAAAGSRGEYLIFMDGDILPSKKFIQDMLYASQKKNRFIFLSRVSLKEGYTRELLRCREGLSEDGFFKKTAKNKELRSIRSWLLASLLPQNKNPAKYCGAVMGFHREDFVGVNGFDNSFVNWGMEDNEIAARLIARGCKKIKLKFWARVYHMWHPFEKRDSVSVNTAKYKAILRTGVVRTADGLDEVLGHV